MQTSTTSQTYAIDPAHSEVGFAVRHLMITKVRGQFTGFSGTIVVAADNIPTAIEGTVATATVATREEKRDAHLRSADFFDAEKFPTITFKSTSITGRASGFIVIGDLTIHGVSKNVTLEGELGGTTTDPRGNARLGYSATGRINRADFGMNFNQALELGGVMVSNEVDLTLEVSAVLQK